MLTGDMNRHDPMSLRDTARIQVDPNTTSREVGLTDTQHITTAIVRGVGSPSVMAAVRCRLSRQLWNGAVA